ncbi:MAG: Ni/Fe-hydrogenase cytochrome b subunit [Melioribacteraceae bacterium]|nr:Ni/Fe-hydrogenase cytochrome b subunit [Melioribacteraceae bacterium]
MEKNKKNKPNFSSEFKNFFKFLLSEMKPKGKLLTPFNIIAAFVIALGGVLIFFRFYNGLASVTNLSQEFPWGIWVGFDVITGVAFAGGAYVVTFLVYILRMEKYHAIVRVTVLNGLLAYMFYAGALLLDLGKPWNIINPVIGNSFGMNSVMFLVAWHFLLYMTAEFLEFSPAIAEWLGWKKVRKVLHGMTLATVIVGITLSILHQAGLGGLFLMAKSKIHPLWYSEFIPILFFVSSIFAGLSMVILEGSITHKVFFRKLTPELKRTHHDILLGLSKICGGTMFVYLFLKALTFLHEQHWHYIFSPMGNWFLVEIVFFVVLPMIMFTQAARYRNVKLVKASSILTLLGIALNRLNISIIAFKWDAVERYVPTWMEIEITMAIILVEIVVLGWIINRMPVLGESPMWVKEQEKAAENLAH